MNLICLDFETFYSNDYTLKKLTTEGYIRDPRFEALCVGISTKEGNVWYARPDIARVLQFIDWDDTALLCHHAQFDGLILSHHFGIKPKLWLDTLSMARLLYPPSQSVSLAALAKLHGLPEKTVPYDRFKGRRYADLSPALLEELGQGAVHDCELTHELFKRMLPDFPSDELMTIDHTVRMFTEPRLVGDANELHSLAALEHMRKGEIYASLQTNVTEIRKNGAFSALLEAQGVEIEYKTGAKGENSCVRSNR